jgi:hypothetical protein
MDRDNPLRGRGVTKLSHHSFKCDHVYPKIHQCHISPFSREMYVLKYDKITFYDW